MPDVRPDAPVNAPPDGSGAVRDLVILCAIAAVVRGWAFGRLGLSHYDEGGYAMSAQALARGDFTALYPLQHFLSPPFYFGFSGVLARLFGLAAERALFLVSAGFGVLTVALVYAAARSWFGRAAGGAAALLVALSDFHIVLSRIGLTDVTFAAWFVMAVWLVSLAEQRRSIGLAALAGAAIGLAWNTKYHGWLVGVVAVAAVLPGLLRSPREEWRGTILRLAVAAGVAIALYLPWLLYVQSQEGGYARLAAEHRRFLQPARFHRASLMLMRQQLAMDGWPSRLAPVLAFLWCAWLLRARGLTVLAWAAALLLAGLGLGETATLGIAALAAVVMLLREHGLFSRGSYWFALAFFAVFTVLSPLYRPYARLLLPWVLACALLASALLARLAARASSAVDGRRGLLGPAAAGAVALAALLVRGVPGSAPTWAPTDGFARAAGPLDSITRGQLPVAVLGEPGMVAYLRARGRTAWALNNMPDLANYLQPGQEAWLVGGIYSRRSRGTNSMSAWLEAHAVGLAAEVSVTRVNDVRLLDDFNPRQAREWWAAPRDDYALRIYRITWTP